MRSRVRHRNELRLAARAGLQTVGCADSIREVIASQEFPHLGARLSSGARVRPDAFIDSSSTQHERRDQ
jgi:hypothetical protein